MLAPAILALVHFSLLLIAIMLFSSLLNTCKPVFMRAYILSILACLAIYGQASATKYYVSTAITASDNNDGLSTTTAFATIGRALQTTNASPTGGDTLLVGAGTYSINAALTITKSVRLFGDHAQVDAGGWDHSAAGKRLLHISNASDVLVDGFVFKNLIGHNSIGILIEGSGRNITVSHCQINNISWMTGGNPLSTPPTDSSLHNTNGILIDGTGAVPLSRINILSDTITNCALGYSEALTVAANTDTFTIADNLIYGVSNIGIDISGHNTFSVNPPPHLNYARNGLITRNTVFWCMSPVRFSAGIYLDGAYNCVVDRNYVFENGAGMSLGCERTPGAGAKPCSQNRFTNNIIHHNAYAGVMWGDSSVSNGFEVVNNSFFNNTVFKNRTGAAINGVISVAGLQAGTNSGQFGDIFGGELHLQRCDSSFFHSNIFQTFGQRRCVEVLPPFEITNASFRYNNFHRGMPGWPMVFEITSGATFNGMTTPTQPPTINYPGFDSGSIEDYPKFLDTTYSTTVPINLRIDSTSPCRNAGNPAADTATSGGRDHYGSQRIFGSRIDIGAAESQTSPTMSANAASAAKPFYVGVFPNPTIARVFLIPTQTIGSLAVYNAAGQVVMKLEKPDTSIDFSALRAGTYWLVFFSESGAANRQMLIRF